LTTPLRAPHLFITNHNNNNPVTLFMLVSKSSSPRRLPHWYHREVIDEPTQDVYLPLK